MYNLKLDIGKSLTYSDLTSSDFVASHTKLNSQLNAAVFKLNVNFAQ